MVEGGGEMTRRLDHFRQQFDDIDLQIRIFGSRSRRHPRAESQKQRVPGRRMQQYGQQRLPCIDAQTRTAALLLAVVDAQARHAFAVLDHADRRHHALMIADHMAARRDRDEGQRWRAEGEGRDQRGGQPHVRRQPGRPRDQDEIANGDSEQRKLGAEGGKSQHAEQQRRGRSARSIDAERTPETDARSIRPSTLMTEQGAHHDGGGSESQYRQQGLGGQGRRHARAEHVQRLRSDEFGRKQTGRADETAHRQRAQQAIVELARRTVIEQPIGGRAQRGADQIDRE